MARRGQAVRRKISPDPVYGDAVLAKFINRSMRDGKKGAARRQVYEALEIIAAKTKKNPTSVFLEAIEAVKPSMEVRSRRIGGAAYQVPNPVRGSRKESLAIRWMIAAARARDNSEFKTYGDKLAAEILDAVNGEGGAVKKKQEMEKMAEANRAFSHFRW